jgi:hypothetical protein
MFGKETRMSNIQGDLGKLLGGDFVPVVLPAEAISSPKLGTVADHILDADIHLTPEQAAKIASAATETGLHTETQARIDGDAQSEQDIADEKLRAQTAEQEIQQAIDDERSRAQGSEGTLTTNLEAETSARQSADSAEQAFRQNADNDLQSQLDAIHGQTRRFFIDFDAEFETDTPTKTQTDAWLAARTPALTPNVGTAFKNSNTSQMTYNHLFVYYIDPDDADELILSDDGVDTVSTASASSLGIVRGAGDVRADLNGDMWLNANTGTDNVIGNRTLTDATADGTVVSVAAKGLTAWLQGMRNNLKDYFAHKANISNPHGVTAAQVGLGSVTNTSDENKPVSTAQQTVLSLKQDKAVSSTVITALSLSAGATIEDAIIAINNKRKNSFYVSDFRTF